jgi:hypothetical protein
MRLAGPLLTPHRFFDDLAMRLEAPGEEILHKMSGAIFHLIARM